MISILIIICLVTSNWPCGFSETDWKTVNEVKRLLHKNDIHSTTIQLEHDEASLNSCEGAECQVHHVHSKNLKCCGDNLNNPPITPHASNVDLADGGGGNSADDRRKSGNDAEIALKDIDYINEKIGNWAYFNRFFLHFTSFRLDPT